MRLCVFVDKASFLTTDRRGGNRKGRNPDTRVLFFVVKVKISKNQIDPFCKADKARTNPAVATRGKGEQKKRKREQEVELQEGKTKNTTKE